MMREWRQALLWASVASFAVSLGFAPFHSAKFSDGWLGVSALLLGGFAALSYICWLQRPRKRAVAAPPLDDSAATGWRALPRLVRVAVRDDGEQSALAASAVSETLSEISAWQLPEVGEHVRRALYWYESIEPSRVQAMARHGHSHWAVLCLMTFAPNGYTREAAVRELDAITSGLELPFLLLRANDWVRQVREVAIPAILRRLSEGYSEHFVRALPIITRLSECRRADHAELSATIEGFLIGSARQALLGAKRSADRRVRRAALELLVKAAEHDFVTELVDLLTDPDPVVAVAAARYVCARSNDAHVVSLVRQLRNYDHARVRLVLLEALVSRDLPELQETLYDALFDRNRAVRELARYALRGDPEVVNGTLYRQALPQATGTRLLAAIAGLGDHPRADNAGAVRPLIERAYSPRVRREALATYGILASPLDIMPVLVSGVADEDRSLSHLACKLLIGLRVAVSDMEIEPLLGSSVPHVRSHALKLLRRQGKWKGLLWALRAFEIDGLAQADIDDARRHVEHWESRFNLSFVNPQSKEVREIAERLPRLRNRISPRAVAFISSVIEAKKVAPC